MDWLTAVAPEVYLLLFCVALFAGFIDSIAGGGGLLTIPALLSVGITPIEALRLTSCKLLVGLFRRHSILCGARLSIYESRYSLSS